MPSMAMAETPRTPGKRLCRKTSFRADVMADELASSPEHDLSLSPLKGQQLTMELETPVKDHLLPSPDSTVKKTPRARRGPRAAKGSNPKASPKVEKSRAFQASKEVKEEKDVDRVEQFASRIKRQCPNIGTAVKIIAALRRSVGQPSNLGYVFTQAELDELWRRCLAFYNEDEMPPSEASGSDSSGSCSDASMEGSPGKQSRSSRQKRDAMLLESFLLEPEDDLSGEEEVDEDAELGEDEECEEGGSRGGGGGFCVEWPPKEAVVEIDDGYPTDTWAAEQPELQPGSAGFNKRCTSVMKTAGVACTLHTELLSTAACPPLQPHQESVAFLLHPKSPVTRLLVDHPTGSGKTWEIIRVLDNYFHDPRPKVPIFPKSPVCRNFYSELLRWPNRYRDYFCCMRPAEAALASGLCDWREKRNSMWNLSRFLDEELKLLCYTIREVLEMKNMFYMGRMRTGLRKEFMAENPGEAMPAGPMRALSYTSAGGSFTRLRDQEDIPRSAMMKIGYTQGCDNVYTNKVVVMDEAHNLVRTQTQYADQLKCLRDLLVKADNLVLAGFTGTPILNKPEEGRHLLDVIKGCNAPVGDEGYMSSFPMRPQKLFPVSMPKGIPDAILTKQLQSQVVVPVDLSGESLRVYDKKRRGGLQGRLLSAYCNVSSFFGSFHDGKHGTKERILLDPQMCCPKLLTIAEEVESSPQKAVIMVSRQSGYNVMLELMRQVASRANPPFTVATLDELTEFNHVSNLRGEKFRVLVADAFQCSEGVSLFAVRRVFLADVPSSPSQLIQQCGRSIRMFGHQGLPEEEQVVVNKIYIATFPKWLQSPLACWVFRLFRHVKDGENESHAKKMLARLKLAGISTLEDMKAQIDAHGEAKQKSLHPRREESSSEKEMLSANDVILFLEMAGLWTEAQPHTAPKVPQSSKGNKPSLPSFAGQSARFAMLAQGSARLKALTSTLTGSKPARRSGEEGGTKNKSSCRTQHLKISIIAAGRNLQDANSTHKTLGEALIVLNDVCEQIDKFTPQTEWQEALVSGLSPLRENDCVTASIRAAANSGFKARDGDLKELTAREVKQMLHHLTRAERVMSLSSAFLAVQALCAQFDEITEGNQEEWKSQVELEIVVLLKRESVLTALREVAPAAYVARDAGGLRTLTLAQARSLRDALEKQRSSDKMASTWSPQALVRAVRDLYSAESMEDAVRTLEPETSDEQALEQLANCTAEFVPALKELRQKAIDYELLLQFGDPTQTEADLMDVENAAAEMEADNQELEAVDVAEVERVELPEGWKLEWVSQIRGKAKEQYRFVDPSGRKYYSVFELRTAITGGIEAVHEARKARLQVRQAETGDRPAVVRTKPFGSSGGGHRKKSRW